jgi:hypothetical protein
MKLITLFCAFLTSFAFAANVPDYEKEKRWAEHVESGLMDGQNLKPRKQPLLFMD